MTLWDRMLQAAISGMNCGCIYAVMGLALATVYNVTRIFDASQCQYVMLGAMLVCVFRSSGLNLVVSIVPALVIPMIIGIVVWRILFHRASQKFPTMTLIMISFGAAMFIEGVSYIIFGTDVRTTSYYLKINPIRIFKATMSPQSPIIYNVLFLLVLGLFILFSRTLLGKGLRACHDQPLAARLVSIDPRKMMYFSYILAVFIGTIGGMAMVPLTSACYNMGTELLIKGFLVAIVGGVTKPQGVIVGGLVLGFLESFAAGFISSSYASIIALTTYVVVLLFRPTGLIGSEEGRI